MRIAEIKNRYLYKDKNNPNGTHFYGVYYDKKCKEFRAVALTHLYVKDKKRFIHVKRGNIKVEKFKEFDVPTGVKNYYYSRDVFGNKINLRNSNVVNISKRYLSKEQSERVKCFAYKNYNK